MTDSESKLISPKKAKTGANSKPIIIWRVRLIQVSLLLFFCLILGKTLYLQIFQAKDLKKTALNQKRRSNLTTIFRGEITDCKGVALAIDTARFNVILRPSNYKASIGQTEQLSKILGITEERIDTLRNTKNKFVKLASFLSREKADEIAKLRIAGLQLDPVNSREYPHGKLAAHLLGFVSWDSSGQAGIEQVLNKELTNAKNESSKVFMRGDGQPLIKYASLKPIINSSFGQQVELTIDSKLQYKVEQILDSGIKEFKAQRGTAIVLNPKNGEIMAWANSPSYDPNFYGHYSPAQTVNWAISQIYEPGSTFKVLTVASALNLGIIKTDYKYIDEGKIKIGNKVIYNHDYKAGKVKEIDLAQLFRFSSNTGAADIGLKMKPQKFYEQLKKFGIGEKTGIEIPGESGGVLKDYKTWREIDIATTSFGQGSVAVTPLQLASSIGVIANHGEWVQPHIIKSIRSADGSKSIKQTKIIKRKVISSRVANNVSDLLAQSIKDNLEQDITYMAGEVPNYEVAGKTGTAQKYCPKIGHYCPGETIASFIGYFPAQKPEFLILVVIDTPKEAGGWGNTVAGPIFNRIGETLVNMYPDRLSKIH